MFKSKKKSNDLETAGIVADFLVEDYRFQRSFVSAVNKLFNEEIKKYESSYVFHTNKIKELADKMQLQLRVFDGIDYSEGLPVTPLNADEFASAENLVIGQTIEPTVITSNGDIVRQGTVILAVKE